MACWSIVPGAGFYAVQQHKESSIELRISPTGNVCGIYDETIDQSQLGQIEIRRASHVEPTPDGDWIADLSPVDGPCFGPFPRRSAALAAEQAWLEQHWLTGPSPHLPDR